MAEEDDIAKQKIQEKIAEKLSKLNQSSAKAYREQLKALNNNNSALETFQNLLEDINTRIEDQSQGFSGLLEQISKINEELGNENKHVNDATKAFRGLESIASRLKDDQKGYTDLNIKQLKQEKSKLKSLEDQAKEAAKQIAIDKEIVDLAHVNLSDIHDLSDEQRAILTAAQENFSVYKRTNELLEERIKEEKKVNRTLGLTKVALEGLGKIPIVGPLLDTNEALDAARTKAKKGENAFQSMSAAMGSMGKSLLSSLADPLVLIGLLVKGFQMFLDIGFAADKQITDLSKSMSVSKEEATATRDRFIEIQNSGESIFNTTKNLVAAQMELADALGATRGFTEQQVKDQVMLTKEMGLTAEEAGGIQQLAMANGKTAKDVTSTIVKQTQALAKQTGIQLNNKEVVQDVAKVSGQLRLQYANNPKLIAKAVVETKKLGINMEIAANAAKGLLDFESSIENELSAELLTGKSLNLERARGLALNGDSVGAAKEMLAQVGSAADFQNMNVIQQEAIAKAVGMSADDLANSLVTQENLSKLGDNTRKQIEEKAQALRDAGKIDEANALLQKAFSDEAAEAALTDIDAQATFNQSIETLKSMLSSIVEGPAADFANWIGDSEHGAERLKNLFESLKKTIAIVAGIIAGRMVFGLAASVGSMIAQVALSKQLKAAADKQLVVDGGIALAKVTGAEASTLGAATPLILGGIAAVIAGAAAYSMMNDGIISPTGGMVVSGPEGSIQLNKKDSIIAGTNLGGGGNNNGGNSSAEIRELKNMVAAIANRPINVSIDGKKVIEATIGANPNTQGDESRKNSYQIS
jgi:hypothetical protein